MKKCKQCNSILRHVGEVEPDTYDTQPFTYEKSNGLHVYEGSGSFVVMLFVGLVISMPLWENYLGLAILVICLFGGVGAYLWRKPRKLYRCVNCGSEYFGKNLYPFKR